MYYFLRRNNIMNNLHLEKETMLELMNNLGYSTGIIKNTRIIMDRFILFLEENSLAVNIETAILFSKTYFDLFSRSRSKEYCFQKVKSAVSKFVRFYETGEVNSRWVPKVFKITGVFSNSFESFLDYEHRRLKIQRFSQVRNIIHEFNNFLLKHELSIITTKCIIDYFIDFSKTNNHPHAFYTRTTVIRGLLVFLFENKYINEDISKYVPKAKYIRSKELPSVYTDDEIKKIMASIDRNSKIGKRDYAMISLAVYLGLRAGDIVNLKFENIDWINNLINITTGKTEKDIILPLLPDIGNAILDYLKNGRRQCELKEIFITDKGKISSVGSSCLHYKVKQYIKIASIDTKGRKTGPHSLRHSLATKLLKTGEPLPVISEVLGHSDTQVTTIYTSVDIESMKDCALEIIPMKSKVYMEMEGDDNAT